MKLFFLLAFIFCGCSGRNSEKNIQTDSVNVNSNKIQPSSVVDTSLVMIARSLNGDGEYDTYSIIEFSNDSISLTRDNRFVLSIRFEESHANNLRSRNYTVKNEKNIVIQQIKFSIAKNKTLSKEINYFLNGMIKDKQRSSIEFNKYQLDDVFDSLKYFELFNLSYYQPVVMRDYAADDIISYFAAAEGLIDLNLKGDLKIVEEIDSVWKFENDTTYNFDHRQITNLSYANGKLSEVIKYGNIQNPNTGIYYPSQDTFFIARKKESNNAGSGNIWEVKNKIVNSEKFHFFSRVNTLDSVIEYGYESKEALDEKDKKHVFITKRVIKSDFEKKQLTIINEKNNKIIYHHEVVFIR